MNKSVSSPHDRFFKSTMTDLEMPEGKEVWGTYMRNCFHPLFVYLINVSKLTEPKIKQLVQDLSNLAKNAVMSTYEQILQTGREEGLEEGREKGREEGEQKTLEKNIVGLYKKDCTIKFIAEAFSIKEDFVIEVLKKHKLV